MVFQLRYSPVAEEDLYRVWDEVWEASQNFDIADKYAENLRNALKQKKKYPKTGSPLTYMGEFTGLYYVTFKEYIAFYRIHGDVIEVVRVLFSRSDYVNYHAPKGTWLATPL
ncbi:type II toxin-antitoxin system RelE/ParE family toxin [Lachnospiraceae bacterium C1.1]|nr:type II toxin-antitoxin system RelE/ParE family toxin [Lachnospiraceae bacterium C1.1]